MGRFIRIKSFFSGAVFMLILICLAVPIFAASSSTTIQVVYNNIKIFIDDVLITPKDASGKIVEPFVYNGTTYLPVRAVAESLGKAVTWDGKTQSVYIGKHESSTPSVYLEDLKVFNKTLNSSIQPTPTGTIWKPTDIDNLGNSYLHGIKFKHSSAGYLGSSGGFTNTYNIDMKYSKMKGKLVYSSTEARGNNDYAYIKLYGDGVLLYTSPSIKADTKPFDFEVDLTGVSSLDLYVEAKDVDFGIVDTGLYQ